MIRLSDVQIEQGDFELNEINLLVPTGEYAILMGPTGSGKTSLIEVICGLRPIRRGQIVLENVDITDANPAIRNVGYVPQDSTLFPTMRVDLQIEFSMEMRKVKKKERRERVAELAHLLEIESIVKRHPHGLSGGEKQRVALARALAFRPRLLCLDEPLSALDEVTKQKLLNLLKRIHEVEKVTALHITHDQNEAQDLGTCRFEINDGIVSRVF